MILSFPAYDPPEWKSDREFLSLHLTESRIATLTKCEIVHESNCFVTKEISRLIDNDILDLIVIPNTDHHEFWRKMVCKLEYMELVLFETDNPLLATTRCLGRYSSDRINSRKFLIRNECCNRLPSDCSWI